MCLPRAKVFVIGLAFKEDCGDIRNSAVVSIFSDLREYGYDLDIFDSRVDAKDSEREYGIVLPNHPAEYTYDSIVLGKR
jgi:UDP-N-acetyl-D-glucosamine/UDP-N-acetyl-D-galactosamine dehydrogenase